MSDDWQVVAEALKGDGRGVDRLLALDALARLREREAQLTREKAEIEGLLTWKVQQRDEALARVAQLEEALREIKDYYAACRGPSGDSVCAARARRALAHEEEAK